MEKTRSTYRTKDGLANYSFTLEQKSDGSWRAYIESSPNYGARSSDAHSTHRLSDGDRRYVCWNESVRSKDDMKQIAAMWADCTQNYIRNGIFADPTAS